MHADSSVFHRTGWLKALAETYGYKTLAVTSAPPGKSLSDGIPFCEVRSCITGARLVSVPFSDHAQPLLSKTPSEGEMWEWVKSARSLAKWRYVELRPISAAQEWDPLFKGCQSYWLHMLNLLPSREELYSNLHRDCVRRRVRHAERESIEYERGASEELIQEFYDLLVITRKRHRILPQPKSWFKNLVNAMRPDVDVRVARKDGIPIAAIFTLRHRGTVVYKYGCSDHRFHHLGGMPFLFWKLIEESKSEGAIEIDLGRTDLENTTLAEFKDRLGATRRTITYLRVTDDQSTRSVHLSHKSLAGSIFAKLPRGLSSGLGSLVYRHIG
jgi:CelD/BcsL family acetyltransferase involved in cellulose biosynthesis